MTNANISELPNATGSHVICNLDAKESKYAHLHSLAMRLWEIMDMHSLLRRDFIFDGSV